MKYKEKGYISVVCYLQNDSKTIEPFIREVSAFLLESFESLQFVFVDDFSSDNTENYFNPSWYSTIVGTT